MCHFGWDIGATKWIGVGRVCHGDGGVRLAVGRGPVTDTPSDVLGAIMHWTRASCAPSCLDDGRSPAKGFCSYAGSVDESGVVVGWPNRPSWVGYPLRQCLFSSPCYVQCIEDDGVCAAIGEYRFGVAEGYRDFLCVTLGTGVGSGLFIDGEVRKTTLPLGHVGVGSRALCSCGQRGCLQSVFSGWRFADAGGGEGFTEPDPVAEGATRLVRVTADIARFLGLEAVVVTGGLVGYWPRFAAGLVSGLEGALAGWPCVAVASRSPHLSAAYGALALSYEGEQR